MKTVNWPFSMGVRSFHKNILNFDKKHLEMFYRDPKFICLNVFAVNVPVDLEKVTQGSLF